MGVGRANEVMQKGTHIFWTSPQSSEGGGGQILDIVFFFNTTHFSPYVCMVGTFLSNFETRDKKGGSKTFQTYYD